MKSFFTALFFSPMLLFAQYSGQWDMSIQNDAADWLSFRISFVQKDSTIDLHIRNAEEVIQLSPSRVTADSIFYSFIDYNAEIAFTPGEAGTLDGYWINNESSVAQIRPLKAKQQKETFLSAPVSSDLSGQWKVKVQLPTRSYDAMFLFQQHQNKLTGTMRTRSGDYRYLEGEIRGDEFYLSSFQGSLIFQLSGRVEDGALVGSISSVTSSSTKFSAVRDDDFELPDSKSITPLVNDQPFQLNLKDENGVQQDFIELTKGKVTIVSIFGTWCPNCVDEMDYFKELEVKYPELKIIAVAFEATPSEQEQQRRVQGFKKRKNISTQFLMGGQLGKENVKSKFPMIDHVGIYPTSFLVDKQGQIQEIYTGFNGPATGILYDKFKEEYEGQIQTLLDE